MKLSVSKRNCRESFQTSEYCRKKEYNACAEPFPFRCRQKKAHIVATDLETAIKEPLQVKVEQEGSSASLRGKCSR